MNIVFYLYLFVGPEFWPSGDLDWDLVNLNEFHDLTLKLDSMGCDSGLTFTYKWRADVPMTGLNDEWQHAATITLLSCVWNCFVWENYCSKYSVLVKNTTKRLFHYSHDSWELRFNEIWSADFLSLLHVWNSILSFSFQSDISLRETTTLVKSVSDTDAKLLVVLPKGVDY